MVRDNFVYVDGPPSHITRKREILEKYPQIKELMGPNPATAYFIIGLVSAQWLLAYFLRDLHWAWIVLTAYLVGAYINHSLYVLIHECAHNLVFKKSFWNKVMGIVCDMALVLPGALSFRKYHMIHHRHLGEYEMDPDIVTHTEGKLVGNSAFKKALWLCFFSLSQAFRPMKVNSPFWNRWIVINILAIVVTNLVLLYFFGHKAFFYLLFSTLFGLGLHPLGGRWIQEHYLTKEDQETYSYYGPLNKLTFNIGYHNEHHDIMNIPWNNLPKLKQIASGYYTPLKSYNSWSWVVWNFIFNPEMNSYSRIIHPPRKRPNS